MSEQKPVAWMDDFGNVFPLGANKGAASWMDDHKRNWKPLFLAAPPAQPAQTQPARLSDERIDEIAIAMFYADEPMDSMASALLPQWLESIARPLARAIAAAVVPPGFVVVKDWQPIETVPKDGTWFLAWRRHGVLPLLLRWDKQYDAAEDQYGDHVYHLTAWMPMLAAAKATK